MRLLSRIRTWWLLQDYVKRGDEGGLLVTPPVCLRHITPWKLLGWINNHTDVCWSKMVMWKQLAAETSWWPDRGCFHPYDYCGKFEGKRLPECEQDLLIKFSAPPEQVSK